MGLFFFYASYFSFFTLRNHWNLRTAAFDMAIEDNVVFNAMRGELLKASPMFGPEGTHLGHHATFFAYVLVPFYALAPRAETLLIIQASLIGAAVIPLFLFARNRLGPYPAVLLAAMYVFYAPLHGANLYDFHYPPLGIGFVFWLAYLVDIGKYRWAVLPLLLSLSVREDMALSVFVLGAYFLLSGVKPRAGLALSIVGIGYFLFMKMAFMPYIRDGAASFVWFYEKLRPEGGPGGFGGVLTTIAGNPELHDGHAAQEREGQILSSSVGSFCVLAVSEIDWFCVLPAWNGDDLVVESPCKLRHRFSVHHALGARDVSRIHRRADDDQGT